MVTAIVSICIVFVPMAAAVWILLGGAIRRRLDPRKRILQAQREAAWRVDGLFHQARIRMEEAAGRRRSGERRIGDGFGSWHSF